MIHAQHFRLFVSLYERYISEPTGYFDIPHLTPYLLLTFLPRLKSMVLWRSCRLSLKTFRWALLGRHVTRYRHITRIQTWHGVNVLLFVCVELDLFRSFQPPDHGGISPLIPGFHLALLCRAEHEMLTRQKRPHPSPDVRRRGFLIE